MSIMNKELAFVYSTQKRLTILSSISALLSWDLSTNLPKMAVKERAEQTNFVAQQIHEIMVSKKLFFCLKKLSKQNLKKRHAIVVKEFLKQVKKARCLPKEFVEKETRTAVRSTHAWETARQKNRFNVFFPFFKKMIALKKREAGYLKPETTPYNALLDKYEEGMTSEKLDKIFFELKKGLIELLSKIMSSKVYANQKKINLSFSRETQDKLLTSILSKMCLPKDRTNISVSMHPFTTRIGLNDVRITTRYLTPMDSFFSAVHEAGHALYELNLPKTYYATVVYDSPSLGLHESQSRFWENIVAKSKFFWKGFSKQFCKTTKKRFSWKNLYFQANIVQPSFIRVDADEVTYCLHIILRYEIERDLINAGLNPKNAKKEWNKKFNSFFGIIPRTDNEGILQDVHWSWGEFGYFPTYAIGSIYSAQILKKIRKDLKDFDLLVEKKSFYPIIEWLNKKIHCKGKTMTAEEIIKKVTGEKLNPKSYLDYLNQKYSDLYDL